MNKNKCNNKNPCLSFTGKYSIKQFIELSFIDWPGMLTSVLFLPRCNFRCPYCHNPELVLKWDDLPDIDFAHVELSIGEMKGWIDGVVITGGEPTLHPHIISLIEKLRNLGPKIKLDTNGAKPDILEKLLRSNMLDCIAMDIKAPPTDKALYEMCAGSKVDIGDICRSISIIMESSVDYIFRTTVVPTLLSFDAVVEIAKYISGAKRYVLQNFQPGVLINPRFNEIRPYSPKEMLDMKEAVSVFVKESTVTNV